MPNLSIFPMLNEATDAQLDQLIIDSNDPRATVSNPRISNIVTPKPNFAVGPACHSFRNLWTMECMTVRPSADISIQEYCGQGLRGP